MPRFDCAYSPFVYRGESASFINRIKTGSPALALYFGEKMADCLIERFDEMDRFTAEGEELMIIPVPLTKARLRLRGYNQALLLADRVCKRLQEKGYKVKLYEDVLEKTRDTAQQKHMDYVSRLENVAGAYHVHQRKICRGRTIVLVDDIMTTGATGSECASRLQSADAEKVIFLVGAALPEQK
jgi:predicted amidophosphoribosyltransferase